MSQLICLSLEVDAAPALEVRGTDAGPPLGWGLVWYPDSGSGASHVRAPVDGDPGDADPPPGWERVQELMRVLRRQRSTLFMGAFAAEDRERRDLDPFVRSYAGRDWTLAFDGDPGPDIVRRLPLDGMPFLEPVGPSREHLLSWFLSRLLAEGARTLAAFGATPLRSLLEAADGEGSGNILLTDGETLVVYAARDAANRLGWARHVPPDPPAEVRTPRLRVRFDSPRDGLHGMVVAGTHPATDGWVDLVPGELLIVRRAAVMDASAPPSVQVPARRRRGMPAPSSGERVMRVLHETRFRYASPVASSSHRFRLEPVHDREQEVLEHDVAMSVQASRHRFEDVFGNASIDAEIVRPYTELAVTSRSLVRLRTPRDPVTDTNGRAPRLPLVWMPWQRQMLLPYLLPPELPETQLRELIEYGTSFARRNDASVVRTLWDINDTIHAEYRYVSGSTGLETTPYDVYATRTGVCQDFANLLICLARLLGVPARYRVGYIHTGADYENQVQSDASHAWTEIYLPWLGWVGLDPTNGCLAGLDHVRVACGRNYLDATPTSGTIWQGGGGEELSVRVEVVPQD